MNLVEKMKEVQEIGEKLKSQGTEYDVAIEKMYQVIGTLKDHWTGNQQDYLVFMERVSKEEKNMRMVGKIISEYGAMLEDIASNTNNLSNQIQTTIGRV